MTFKAPTVLAKVEKARVPPLLTVALAPFPKAVVDPAVNVPPLTVVLPVVKLLAPDKVSVPLVRARPPLVPVILPENVPLPVAIVKIPVPSCTDPDPVMFLTVLLLLARFNTPATL